MALLGLSIVILAITTANCFNAVERFSSETEFVAKCSQYEKEFDDFKKEYLREYETKLEDSLRFRIFCDNMEKANELQAKERGTATYGVTKFSDLTEKEFRTKYLGLKFSGEAFTTSLPAAVIPKGPIPANFDWRKSGKVVTPVKNQGSCGSCWAFSVTGNVEGQWALKNKKLYSLSEQELVDCDKVDKGCEGGLPLLAYQQIIKLGGLEQEKDYPYEGQDDKCKLVKSKVVVTLTGAEKISRNETDMAVWLYHNGPISIGINAANMQFYHGGIARPTVADCDPSALDHGVLIVGYGVKRTTPFWIIKNSWGTNWGEQGYYYVYRGDGACGLNTACTSANVTKK